MCYFFRVRLPPLDLEPELDRPDELLPLDLDPELERPDEPLLEEDPTLRPEELLLPRLTEEPLPDDELLRTRLEDVGVFRAVGFRTVLDGELDFRTRLPLLTLVRVEDRPVVLSTLLLDEDFLTRLVGMAVRSLASDAFAIRFLSEASLRTRRLPPGSSTPSVFDVRPDLETAEDAGA